MTGELLRPTPFHLRVAEANHRNLWENRGGFTLASAYSDAREEALAARFGAVLADISWHWRVAISGSRTDEFVSRVFTRDATALVPGTAFEALWLNDAGAVRGSGVVVRPAGGAFLLDSEMEDVRWLAEAAALYGVNLRDATAKNGVLALLGPTSADVLAAAGLDPNVKPFALRQFAWRGLDVSLSRFGNGYELWCEPDDALIVWDRIVKVGHPFALSLAGQTAMDMLDLESGIARAGRDFEPARNGFSPSPSPQSLGLAGFADGQHAFNGRARFRAAGQRDVLAGIQLDSDTPVPRTALLRGGRTVGRTLGSLYSPALRRAVALAVVAADAAVPGTALRAGNATCSTCALPFLPFPAPIVPATETAAPSV